MSRQIDALVAQHVFGCDIRMGPDNLAGMYMGDKPYCHCDGSPHSTNPRFPRYTIKNYSTQIQDAWCVVEKMKEKEVHCSIVARYDGQPGDKYGCEFENRFYKGEPDHIYAGADTPSMAICLAALKALGVKYE